MKLKVNGQTREVQVVPEMPLLWVLREQLGLTGTKYGCGIAECRACTVHVNGEAVQSCQLPVGELEGADIITIEGLSTDGQHPVQKAWVKGNVPQCGYCQSGMVMAVAALLKRKPAPSDAEIDAEIQNICRCGSYPRVREAIHQASKESSKG